MTAESQKGAIAAKAPIGVAVKAGQSYWWCACGLSKRQPFCDGSHKPTAFIPQEFKATEDKTVYFCACKQTVGAPLCDGTHKSL
jgi:CDGSH-type Zn-finger protein